MCPPEVLWVPLHAEYKVRTRTLDRLDESVATVRTSRKARRNLIYCLVMKRVHWYHFVPVDCSEARVCHKVNHVCHVLTRRLLRVLKPTAPLTRQVLIERAAEHGIHHLNAATDAKYRLVSFEHRLQQLRFHGVSHRRDFSESDVWLLPKIARVDIDAAGQEQPV